MTRIRKVQGSHAKLRVLPEKARVSALRKSASRSPATIDMFDEWLPGQDAREAVEAAHRLTLADLHIVRRCKVNPALARCIREASGLYGGEDRS